MEKAETIQTLLFVAAINTLLQTWFGTRLPVVVGASYAFLIPAFSVAFSSRMSIFLDPHQVSTVCVCLHGCIILLSMYCVYVHIWISICDPTSHEIFTMHQKQLKVASVIHV